MFFISNESSSCCSRGSTGKYFRTGPCGEGLPVRAEGHGLHGDEFAWVTESGDDLVGGQVPQSDRVVEDADGKAWLRSAKGHGINFIKGTWDSESNRRCDVAGQVEDTGVAVRRALPFEAQLVVQLPTASVLPSALNATASTILLPGARRAGCTVTDSGRCAARGR